MKKLIIASLVMVLMLGLTVPALAENDNSVSARISVLIEMIAKLQAELKMLQSQSADCRDFGHNFGVGQKGQDVAYLHQILVKENLSGTAGAKSDSNFDEATASAVVRLQAKYGIPQTGYVGPLTRAKLNELYGCRWPKPVPTPVPAPVPTSQLQVTTPNGGEVWTIGSNQTIKWSVGPELVVNRVNIYLIRTGFWNQFSPRYVIATDIANAGSYDWRIGQLKNSDDDDEKKLATVGAGDNYQIEVCYRNSNGKDRVCDRSNGTFQLKAAVGNVNQPPTVSGVSGPTTLTVNQTGTWSVAASDPENGPLTYKVDWGDQLNVTDTTALESRVANVQTATFTHAYARPGNYTITFIVTDGAGLQAKTSLSARVNAPTLNSGIRGTVTVGPTCPVVRIGLDCADRPLAVLLKVKNLANNNITPVISDSNGHFEVILEPGTYTIYRGNDGNLYPTLTPQTVTVVANQYTNINLQFDSGIR